MKQEFLNFVNALMEAAPEVAESLMTDSIRQYMEALVDTKKDKPVLTDNGKLILKFLQENTENTMWKSKDIAEGLFISSRTVSGAIRKLVTDEFVEKVSQEPVIYTITEKGKNFIIED